MKRNLLFLFFMLIIPLCAKGDVETWVSDINANNGHVTYTVNVYLPIDNDTLHMKNRRDYICSQRTEAILWGEGKYLSTGKTIDYTSFMDKSKLRKYKPVTEKDYDILQEILSYCKNK